MFLLIPGIELVECLAIAGFDLVIFDLEHGRSDPDQLLPVIAAAQGAGLYAVVRMADRNPARIGRILDLGPDGILVPHVADARQAGAIVSAARFPPHGERSVHPHVRALGYVGGDRALAEADARTAVICMIEGEDGLAASVDIGATPGVDGLFVGPVDLSAALGIGRPDPEHPKVVERAHRFIQDGASGGVATGIYAPTAEAARRWVSAGATLVACSVDIAVFRAAARTLRDSLAPDGE